MCHNPLNCLVDVVIVVCVVVFVVVVVVLVVVVTVDIVVVVGPRNNDLKFGQNHVSNS